MSLEKFIKRVGCLSPRSSILDACREMQSKQLGCVVVISDDAKPIGLLTDRDVVVRVVAAGKPVDRTTVEEAMSREVFCLPRNASIRAVTEAMRDRGVRRIPITGDDGRVQGMVTLDDVLLLLGMEIGNLANAVIGNLARERGTELWESA